MTTRIYLVRHGETLWNRELRCQGHTDVPLSDTGRQQARELAARLRDLPLAAAYSSDLRRAFETAELVAAPHGLRVTPLASLRERNMGRWEGLTVAERQSQWPQVWPRWEAGERDVPGVELELYEKMVKRLFETLADIADRHPGQATLAVSHGGAISSVLERVGVSRQARGPYLGNCSLTPLVSEDGRSWRLEPAAVVPVATA